MKLKDQKGKPNNSKDSLTATEKKLIDEMDTKPRLSTINEEKSKWRGFRNNRLAPLEDPKKVRNYD